MNSPFLISRRALIAYVASTAFTQRAFADTAALPFLVVGDWGNPSGAAQRAVAASMGRVADDISSAFVISTGDNFYSRGVRSVTDPQWQDTFENVYSAQSLQTPWYAILGNHDYGGSPEAEIAYTGVSGRWRMPARYWRQDIALPSRSQVSFFFLDTTPITRLSGLRNNVPGFGAGAHSQLQWLERELAGCASPWKIVVGHHPILSSGNHGPSPEVAERVQPLLERYRVQAYFNGHDHDLEHLHANGVDYICSGSGSEARQVHAIQESQFAYAGTGFAACELSEGALTLNFHDGQGAIVYGARIERH